MRDTVEMLDQGRGLLTMVLFCRIMSNDHIRSKIDTCSNSDRFEHEKIIKCLFNLALNCCRAYVRVEMSVMYVRFLKRFLDVLCAAFALLVLSPILLLLALWVKLDSTGPVFFRQKRVGKGKVYFDILKFRTMRIDTPHDVPTHLLADPTQWITRSGAFLRKTSLDELPQLINILRGDMSFVGPRPALWNQFDLIEERDRYGANDIPQGLTGWAQINGRDELEIEEKARLDGEYAAKIGFVMYLRCLLLTFGSVLGHKGVVEGGTGELQRMERTENESEHQEEIAS